MAEPTGYPDLDALLPRLDGHPGARRRRARGGAHRRAGPEERRAHRRAQDAGRAAGRGAASATAPRVNQLKARFEAAFAARRGGARGRAAPARAAGWTSPCRAARRWVGRRAPGHAGRRRDRRASSASSASPWPRAPRSRPSGTTSSRSTSRPTIRRWTCTTRSTSTRRRSTGEPAGRLLLRTHTSPVQIRTMLASPPPVRVVIPGMVYRNDAIRRLAPAGLLPDRGPRGGRGDLVRGSQGDADPLRPPVLLAATEDAVPALVLPVHRALGGDGRRVPALPRRAAARRARAPAGWRSSAAAWCTRRCSRTCGLDPERYTGWAFGMGPHRIALLRYGVPDIRLLLGGDMRFLEQSAAGRAGARMREARSTPVEAAMNISSRWLEDFLRRAARRRATVAATRSPCSARRSTRSSRCTPSSAPFVVARVLEVGPHPDPKADQVRLTRWTTARGEPLTVVCGAPNVDRRQELSLRPVGTHDARAKGVPTIEARQDPRRREPRACSAPRASSAWARSTTASSSSTPTPRPGTPLLEALPLGDTGWSSTSRPTAPISSATRASRASSRRRTGRRSGCRRFPAAESLDVPPARRAGASRRRVGGVRIAIEDAESCPRFHAARDPRRRGGPVARVAPAAARGGRACARSTTWWTPPTT